jgi:hypothetical protein
MPKAETRHITIPYPAATVPLAERYRELLQARLEAEQAAMALVLSPLSIDLQERHSEADERLHDAVDLFICCRSMTREDTELRHAALRLIAGHPDREMFRRLARRIADERLSRPPLADKLQVAMVLALVIANGVVIAGIVHNLTSSAVVATMVEVAPTKGTGWSKPPLWI